MAAFSKKCKSLHSPSSVSLYARHLVRNSAYSFCCASACKTRCLIEPTAPRYCLTASAGFGRQFAKLRALSRLRRRLCARPILPLAGAVLRLHLGEGFYGCALSEKLGCSASLSQSAKSDFYAQQTPPWHADFNRRGLAKPGQGGKMKSCLGGACS